MSSLGVDPGNAFFPPTEVTFMDPDGQNRVQLTFFNEGNDDGYVAADLDWSPLQTDTLAVYVHSQNGAVEELYMIELDQAY